MPKVIDKNKMTRFGRRVYEAMDAKKMSQGAITEELGIWPDHWRRMISLSHKNTSIYLPMVLKLSRMLEIPAIELLLLVYDDQVLATDLTDAEKMLYSQLLTVFHLLYRLRDEDQDFAVSQIENLLNARGGRDMSVEQAHFLDKLRMHPIHEAGRGDKMQERMKKASAIKAEA